MLWARRGAGGDLSGDEGWQEVRSGLEVAGDEEDVGLDRAEKRDRGFRAGDSA